MTDWIILGAGIVILALVWSDRRRIASAWRSPASWWTRDPDQYMRSREPSQPLNFVVGTILGVAALVYGIASLLG